MSALTEAGPDAGAVTFRPYRPSDKETLLAIIGRVWDDRRQRLHEMLWDWQHERDALAPDPDHLGIVMESDGLVVGYSGALPVEFAHDGETFYGAVLLDTCVLPEYRGLGRRLLRHQLQKTSLLMGAPTVRAHALWKRMTRQKSIVVSDVRKRIQILDVRPFLTRRRVPRVLGSAAQLVWRVARRLRQGGSPSLPTRRLQACEVFPSEIDALARTFAREFSFCILRTASFLNWRFGATAPVSYEKRLLWDGEKLVGYVVYRLGRMNGRRVLFLLEAVAIDRQKENYQVLLEHVRQVAEGAGVCDVQTMETGCPALTRELDRRGYFARKDEVSIVGYSTRAGGKIYDGGWFVSAGGADFEFTFFNQGAEELLASSRPGDAKPQS